MSKPLITNGLAAYYSFDGDVKDYSGNGFDGIAKNITYVPGISGKAIFTNKSNQSYVEIDNIPKIFDESNKTFSCWVANIKSCKVSNIITSSASQNKDGNRCSFSVKDISVYQGSNITFDSPNDDNWHHYCFTVGSDGTKVYIDGKLVASDSRTVINNSGTASYPYYSIGNHWYNIAHNSDGTPNLKIDEVYIFDRALTEDEIQKLYLASIRNVQLIRNPNTKKPVFNITVLEQLSDTLKEYTFPSNSTDKYAAGNGTVQLSMNSPVNYNLNFEVAAFASVDNDSGTGSSHDYVKVTTAKGDIVFQVPGNTNQCKVISNATPYEATVTFIKHYDQDLPGQSGDYRYTNTYQISVNNLDKSENKITIETHTDESFNNEALGYKLGSVDIESSDGSIDMQTTTMAIESSVNLSNNSCDFFNDESTIAYYPFDGNANDACGKYNGVTNNVTYVSGKFGQAIKISNENLSNYTVQFDSNIPEEEVDELSVSFWFKQLSTYSNRSNLAIIATTKGTINNSDWKHRWDLSIDPNTLEIKSLKALIDYDNNINYNLANNEKIDLNKWYFVAFSYKNGGSFYGLIKDEDGNIILEKTIDNVSGKIMKGFALGKTNDYSNNNLVDDAIIFNRALTSDEIQNLYTYKQLFNLLEKQKQSIVNYIETIKNMYSFTNNEVYLQSGSSTVKTEFIASDKGLFLVASVFETTDSEFLILNTLDFTNKKINLIIPGLCSNYLINNEKCSLEVDMPNLEANKTYNLELQYSFNDLIVRIFDGQNKIFENQFKINLLPILSDNNTKFSFSINCYLPVEMGMYFNALGFLKEDFLYLGNQFINTSYLGSIPFDNNILVFNNEYNDMKITDLVNINIGSNTKFESNSLNYRYYLITKTPETVSQTDETSLKLFDLTLSDSYNLNKLVVLMPITVTQQSTDTSNWYPVITVGDTNPTEVKIDTGKINYSTFIKIIYDQNKNIDVYYLDLNETIESFDFKLNWVKVNENPVANANTIALQLKGLKTQASISSRGIYFFSDDIVNKCLQKTTINTVLPFVDSSYDIQSNILLLTDQ